MNILLFGKGGQVGWELQRSLSVLGTVTALDFDSTEYCGDFANPAGVADTVRALRPDVIVPVPQFDDLTHMRGFVPLLHIMQQVDVQGVWLDPPLIKSNAVIRLHHAHLQVSSAPEQRRKQIKNAFAASCDFTGQQVLLIDDVYTTGATLNELARVCLEAGAKSVDALVLARGRKVK